MNRELVIILSTALVFVVPFVAAILISRHLDRAVERELREDRCRRDEAARKCPPKRKAPPIRPSWWEQGRVE